MTKQEIIKNEYVNLIGVEGYAEIRGVINTEGWCRDFMVARALKSPIVFGWFDIHESMVRPKTLQNNELFINHYSGPKTYSEADMISASKYGYESHKNTQFPEQNFEDSCINNTKQWLTTFNK